MINGILNVYKEKGFTSHDVVAKLRGICRQKKIGHTGTLDPDATGVLPVCLGNATKLCEMLTDKSKEYEAEFQLGITTDTQDMSGTVLQEQMVDITIEQLKTAIGSFIGGYEQIPPMYSAKKVDGKKLYELARQGITIERKAVPVEITEIKILEINLPLVRIHVSCGKGTYIRTLCHDIGERLGCGAAMSVLIRTRVGRFSIEQAVTLNEVEHQMTEGLLTEHILAADQVLEELQARTVLTDFRKLVENGNLLLVHQMAEQNDVRNGEQVRIYDEERHFYGIYEYYKDRKAFLPVKMF